MKKFKNTFECMGAVGGRFNHDVERIKDLLSEEVVKRGKGCKIFCKQNCV